jgi:hypothetical protein
LNKNVSQFWFCVEGTRLWFGKSANYAFKLSTPKTDVNAPFPQALSNGDSSLPFPIPAECAVHLLSFPVSQRSLFESDELARTLKIRSVKKTELTTVGIRHADHVPPSIRKKIALTSPTSGCRLAAILRSQTEALEFIVIDCL